jgi:hypothetical protein
MSTQQTCTGCAGSNKDLQHSSQFTERLLNDAIVRADISRSFEEYLEIVNRFYADEVVLTSEGTRSLVRGKDALRSLLAFFLIPLHIMAEIGGMRTVVHVQPIASDNLNETHAAWMVDLVGVSGKTCTLKWRTQREWEGSRVVYEHHYDEQQIGGPLTLEDLNSPFPAGAGAVGTGGGDSN